MFLEVFIFISYVVLCFFYDVFVLLSMYFYFYVCFIVILSGKNLVFLVNLLFLL